MNLQASQTYSTAIVKILYCVAYELVWVSQAGFIRVLTALMGAQTSSQTQSGSIAESHPSSSEKPKEAPLNECPVAHSGAPVTALAAPPLSKQPAAINGKQSVPVDGCPMHGEQKTSSECPVRRGEEIDPRNMVSQCRGCC